MNKQKLKEREALRATLDNRVAQQLEEIGAMYRKIRLLEKAIEDTAKRIFKDAKQAGVIPWCTRFGHVESYREGKYIEFSVNDENGSWCSYRFGSGKYQEVSQDLVERNERAKWVIWKKDL